MEWSRQYFQPTGALVITFPEELRWLTQSTDSAAHTFLDGLEMGAEEHGQERAPVLSEQWSDPQGENGKLEDNFPEQKKKLRLGHK